MAAYKVERARATDADLEAIFDFLVQSYVEFGDAEDEAIERAAKRLEGINDLMLALGAAPHRGTKRDEILPGLRSVTKDRAIYYFDVDEDARRVRVLAIFFGGQDHRRAMLKRLMKS